MRRNLRTGTGRAGAKASLVVLLVGIAAATGWGHMASGQSDTVRAIMQEKLDHAHGVLEAMIFEDLEAVETDAAWLSLLAEAAEWHVYETPEYTKYSTEFFKSVGALSEAARSKDLEGAAAAYAQMTVSCVSCHKYVRGVRQASARAD